MSVAFFMVALDALVVITALPSIGADLRTGLPTREWTVNTYGLATAAGLGDRYGRRRVFTIRLALFTAASAPAIGDALASPIVVPHPDTSPVRRSSSRARS